MEAIKKYKNYVKSLKKKKKRYIRRRERVDLIKSLRLNVSFPVNDSYKYVELSTYHVLRCEFNNTR